MNVSEMYPEHLYEPLRRKIAERFIQHELRKLFPSLKEDGSWKLIDADVARWFSGNLQLTPVRIFWNGFHAIARGFRFKNLLPKLTSKNVKWKERKVQLSDLWFGAAFEGMGFVGQHRPVTEIKSKFDQGQNLEIKQELLSILQKKGEYTAPRDTDPIIVNRINGVLMVVDGNRRLFEAMCNGREIIDAFVGEPAGIPEIFEEWVPAQFLQDLLFLHSRSPAPSKNFTVSVTQVIAEALKNSTSGQNEWRVLCLKSTEPLDKFIYNEVSKILSQH